MSLAGLRLQVAEAMVAEDYPQDSNVPFIVRDPAEQQEYLEKADVALGFNRQEYNLFAAAALTALLSSSTSTSYRDTTKISNQAHQMAVAMVINSPFFYPEHPTDSPITLV